MSIVRHPNESFEKARRAASANGKPSYEPSAHLSSATIVAPSRFPAKAVAAGPFRRSLVWRLGLAGFSLGLAWVWAPVTALVPTKGLAEAGVAAFQAFARPGVAPVEFATSDEAEAQAWLTARLTHPVFLPATPAGVKLIGARITPYPGAPAAFLIYKSQDGALGLLIRSLDAPPAGPPELLAADDRDAAVWTERGQGLALVGDPAAALLLKIATEFSGPLVAAAQAAPERGW